MELRDYGTALRRHWTTGVGVVLACLLAAVVVVLATPPTYRATAQVFVASSGEGTSGAQFVNQRVTSYPDVARSRAVLDPVIEDLGLDESFADLRARVEASNPLETSQIDIAVTGRDAAEAARVADAVAEEFGAVVEQLERPAGGAAPVDLTVTNPATVPTSPASPQTALLIGLALVVGLALGAAAAVVRSRVDGRLNSADDVRAAWHGADDVPVLARPAGRARRSALAGEPGAVLARRLEALAEDRPVSVALVSSSPELTPWSLVEELAQRLRAAGLPTAVVDPAGDDAPAGPVRVRLSVVSPLMASHDWRRLAGTTDVVVAVAPGRAQRADLAELGTILTGAGIRPLALVLTPIRSGGGTPQPVAHPEGTPALPAAPVPTPR
ncbi:YveK family protein [Geodermatophilus sp. SYSU D01176]